MKFGMDVPKKYIHSLECFCENNNLTYELYNLASLHIDPMAEFHFQNKEDQEQAARFLQRLIQLDQE